MRYKLHEKSFAILQWKRMRNHDIFFILIPCNDHAFIAIQLQNERKTSKGNFYHKVVYFFFILFVFHTVLYLHSFLNGWLRLNRKWKKNPWKISFENQILQRWIEILQNRAKITRNVAKYCMGRKIHQLIKILWVDLRSYRNWTHLGLCKLNGVCYADEHRAFGYSSTIQNILFTLLCPQKIDYLRKEVDMLRSE